MPTALQQPQSFVAWGSLVGQVIKRDLPTDVLRICEDDRVKEPWCKAKKWAQFIVHKLIV
ncbi:hypothetical protein HDU93_000911, partial [Gonapodya sp. JEL0774]